MSFGRSLLIAFALLAYLGQSLAFAMPECEARGDAHADIQHGAMMDMEPMNYPLSAQQGSPEPDMQCCDSPFQCLDEGCQSPIPATNTASETPLFSGFTQSDEQFFRPISGPFYRYRPPILS